MLTFELVKLLVRKTKVSPAWTMVWNRWSLEIFSTSNYFMLLGSITPGAPIPEHGSDASGSQVTCGTGRRVHLRLGQPYRWWPSRDTQEITRYPSRHLAQSSRRECSCHHGWGSLCCLERRTSKPAAFAQAGQQKPRSLPSPQKGPGHRRQKKVLCCF